MGRTYSLLNIKLVVHKVNIIFFWSKQICYILQYYLNAEHSAPYQLETVY